MKRFSLIAMLCIFPLALHAQSHAIKFNPLILSFKAWNLSYEYTSVESKWGIQVGAIIFGDGFFIDTRMTGTQITVDYKRYFPNKKTYLAPYLRYQAMEFRDSPRTVSHKHPGVGLMVGRIFHPFKIKWWVMDMYLGINHISKKYKILEGNPPVNIDVPTTIYGTGPRVGITMGVKF